jgi:hypothetical protein
MNNRKFGIELECFNVAIHDVVAALRNAGINAHSASYSGREYSVWQIKTDGSIQGVDGFEVVSPILVGEDGITEAKKVCNILAGLGAKVNKSCGFHIHHNAKDWKLGQFKNLFKRFAKYESALDSIQPVSRRENNNRYCQSIVNRNGVANTFSKIDSCRNIRMMSNLFDSRYVKLNFQSFIRMGTVEFRNHAGTFDAVKVENYIRLTGGMVALAEKGVKVSEPVANTASESLKALLDYMTRSKAITKEMSAFYKARATKLETA